MSMWADYIREMGLLEIIEEEYGWVTFHIQEPSSVVINDLYVRPANRRSGKGTLLLQQVEDFALKFGCTTILVGIHRESATKSGTYAAALVSGFVVHEEAKLCTIMRKDLGGK